MRYYRITLMNKRPAKCTVCGSETVKEYWQKEANYIETEENMKYTADLFYDGEDGEAYLIERVEMTEEEFSKLPEFTGF